MDVRKTIEKAECWRTDAFELWCWSRHFRVPWTARRSNQSILKIRPEYSLEGLKLNQYFSHVMQRIESLEKTPMLRKGWQRMRWWRTSVWVGSGSWWWTGKPGVLQSMGSQRVGHDWVTKQNWHKPLHEYKADSVMNWYVYILWNDYHNKVS